MVKCVSSDYPAGRDIAVATATSAWSGRTCSSGAPSHSRSDVTRAAGSRVVVGPGKLLPGQCRTQGSGGRSWGRGEAEPVRGRPGAGPRLSGGHGGGREGGGEAQAEEPPQQLPRLPG